MHRAAPQESLLFDECSLDCDDTPLVLDRRELLDTILRLRQVESMLPLRIAIGEFQQRVRKLANGMAGTDAEQEVAESVTIEARYLLADLQQVSDSRSVERARYYLDRLARSITEVKTNGINDINLNRWKEYDDVYTDSLWVVERRDNSGVHTAGYWGNFIPQIPNQMIKRYTRKGEWVLDAFVGCGTTLIESQRLGRNGIGIELQDSIASRARELVAAEPNLQGVCSEVVTADCTLVDYKSILQACAQSSVQLLIMHPPYFDIIKFSDDPRDLSNAGSVNRFLERLSQAVDNAASVLDAGRYFALVIGDKYAAGEWIPLGFLAMDQVRQHGFGLKSVIVKNFEDTTAKRSQTDLWRYRALAGGFYVFKHEYVFVFHKKRGAR